MPYKAKHTIPEESTCEKCSSVYKPRRYLQKYCSDRCRWSSLKPQKRAEKRIRSAKRYEEKTGETRSATYWRNNKEKALQANYDWKKRNPTKTQQTSKKAMLRSKYGITIEQYETLMEKQSYCCAICGKKEETQKRALAIDHSHLSGEIRAALCYSCNRNLIGHHNDPELFLKAYHYLKGPHTGWFVPERYKKGVRRKRKKKS